MDLTQQPQFTAPKPNINAGSVEIESKRAVAEALAQVRLAQIVGRDLNAVYHEVMENCSVLAMANVAFYSVKQGGGVVSGPSIKLIEQIANAMCHIEWGHRELSRIESTPDTIGRSEIEVFAWDKLKNNRSIRQITVLHAIDTKDGPRKLRDQRQIDNQIANIAAKQMRGRLVALLPKWLVEAAIERCRDTLKKGDGKKSIGERVRDMVTAFAKFGVTPQHITKYLDVSSLENITIDQLESLVGVYAALREGARPSEFFSDKGEVDNADVMSVFDQLPAAAPAATIPPTAVPAAEPVKAPVPTPEPQQDDETLF